MDDMFSSYERFLSGNKDALTDIVKACRDPLIWYLYKIVGDLDAAEELAQDTFVKLLIKRPKNSGESSFKTWLYTIGRNTAIDYLRKKKREKSVPLSDVAEILQAETDLKESILKTERDKALFSAMGRLKKEYAEILWLTYFEGLSNEKSAKVLKKSRNAVAILNSRARAALKEELQKENISDEDL
ncbi:MAG: RNA polymerase sigma factor [Oscillospiraceae bacterium]|nr:RNA polymerase sigma factor [Oscillospiraceae bacterium]